MKSKLSEYSPSVTETVITISPLKSTSGIAVSWLPETINWVLPSTALYVKSSPSTSNADNVKTRVPSSSISWLEIESKIGASLTGFTVIVI